MRRRDQVYLWLRDHPIVVDSGLALFLFAVQGMAGWMVIFEPVGAYRFYPDNFIWSPGIWPVLDQYRATLLVLVSAGLTLPLALRRVRPVWAGAVVAGTAMTQWLVGVPPLGAQVSVLIVVHALAAYAPRWAGRSGLVLGLLGAPMAAVRYFPVGYEQVVIVMVGIAALVLASWAVGDLQRVRRQQLEGLRERARRLEVEREQEARLAAADERARIAREMHDVVAHSLSVVIAQADGGRYAADGDSKAAVRACETISDTGRAALTDMRRLLGVLRTDDPGSRAPTPTLADLDDLIQGVRSGGLSVGCTVTGTPRPVGSGIELASYRIVQEALTNVLKHAGPDVTVQVRVEWTPAGLAISVTDDGRGAAADGALRHDRADPQGASGTGGAGHGIPGMSERASLYGGKLSAGPLPGGGFAVRALLPYPVQGRMHG